MEHETNATDPQALFKSILEIVPAVIRDPASFYRGMPRSGGYLDPFVFTVCIGFAAGVIQALLGIIGLGPEVSFTMALSSLVMVPILVGLFSFVTAGILFMIWRAMGSREQFEVSYRCVAFSFAITPITSLLNVIPYAGPIIGILWGTYILVCASIEVHRVKARTAWVVLGLIAAFFAVMSINAQISARRFEERIGKIEKGLGDIDKMKPEEAGQAVGEFLKGMQKGMEKK